MYFTKIYHPARGVHRQPIHYSGMCDDKFTQIEGDWRIANGFSGRFVMYRSSFGTTAAAAKREVVLQLKR